MDQFRSVPGKIESMSNTVDLDDIKSSVSQSTFRIKMASGNVIDSSVRISQRLNMRACGEMERVIFCK
jgi:hypothetical protein